MQKALIYFSVMSFFLLSARAKGDIYTTGVALNFANGQGSIAATTQPNLMGDGAAIGLAIDVNSILSPTSYTVGIPHVWYSLAQGTAIDPAFTSTASAFANAFTGDLSGRIQLTLGQTFLLGFWLDANGNANAGAGDRFGWARITYNASGLMLVDSAIESTGIGIIAGTTTEVPEPSTACLVFVGFAAASYILRRRKLSQRM